MVLMYRLLIAVLARLVMIALGALLLYGSWFYLALIATPTTRAMLAQGLDPTGEASSKPLVYIGLVGSGLALVGCVVLFFGLRGLWRRIQAGMPTEDESRAETTTGRLASAAVFGAGALLGLLKLTLVVYALGDQIALAWTGVETNAVVTRKWSGDWARPGSDRPPNAGYQIEFTFDTPTGEVRQETRISSGLYRTLEEGAAVPVTYAAGNPSDFRIEFAKPRAVLINVFIWLGLLSVGLWGVRRNLGSDDGDDAASAPHSATPTPGAPTPATPSTFRSSGGSPVRRQFGQR